MVVSDKPVPSWSDEDEQFFEIQVNEIARRFMNLEALDKVMAAQFRRSYHARRVVVTKPDGTERQRVLWLNENAKTAIEQDVSKLMSENKLFANPERMQGAIAVMLDRLLEMPDIESGEAENTNFKERNKLG